MILIKKGLNKQADFGPIPRQHLGPWLFIITLSLMPCLALELNFLYGVAVAFWLCLTWALVCGRKPWIFLSNFVPCPKWIIGFVKLNEIS